MSSVKQLGNQCKIAKRISDQLLMVSGIIRWALRLAFLLAE